MDLVEGGLIRIMKTRPFLLLCRKSQHLLLHNFNFYISAYGLGLMVTFVGLYMMAVAQPALLYLVPFTLIPVFLLGLCRREFALLWNGDGQVKINDGYLLKYDFNLLYFTHIRLLRTLD